ncbi:MAG: ATP-binding cassette domain-containing protein [Clostridia bacterium]|nr:ATP-binding cassette domain-containing protein [Clostridia bacterium]
MLKLTNIVKSYLSGSSKVEALKDVSIEFRKNEFVSILGPSGCGKTTLLNIIGGLDRYDSGDLRSIIARQRILTTATGTHTAIIQLASFFKAITSFRTKRY